MRITETAIKAIKDSTTAKRELTYQLETSYTSLYRWLDENPENGRLTTHLATKIISEETGLKVSEIIDETPKESTDEFVDVHNHIG